MIDPLVGVRAIHIAATAMVAGTIFFQVFISRPAERAAGTSTRGFEGFDRRLASLVTWALAISVLSNLAWLALLAADLDEQTISAAIGDGTVLTVLTDTRFGNVLIFRLALAALLAANLGSTDRIRELLSVIAAALFIAAMALPGHSGATPGLMGQFYLLNDGLHLIAAGAWIGGLLPSVLLLALSNGRWRKISTDAVHRFSVLGIVSEIGRAHV